MSEDNNDLRSRMSDIENSATASGKRNSVGKIGGVAAAVVAAGLGGYFVLDSLSQPDRPQTSIPSSAVQEFPEDRSASDSLEQPAAPEPVIIERPVITTQTDSATLARLRELEDQLAAAEELAQNRQDETASERELREGLERDRDGFARDIAALRSSAENDQDRAREALQQLQDQVAGLERNANAARQQAETELARVRTQAEQDAAQREAEYSRQLREARAVDPLEQERLALERAQAEQADRDRERLEELRAERLAQEQKRATSSMLAYGGSGATEAGAAEGRVMGAAESFVKRAVEPVPISRASQIANPQATIPQGSIIQASLETALDSTLPGAIRAVVSEDVHSIDGSAVLIPAGSKVFGEYSDGIALGQKRILIVWTRILTPSNRSVTIASYGADRLGRSGTGGAVDSRFGTKFGGAAAISIIGAGPSIIAGQSNDQVTVDTIENVGDDLARASDSAIGEYLTIPPTIYVRQGTSVTILLDRDVEIF